MIELLLAPAPGLGSPLEVLLGALLLLIWAIAQQNEARRGQDGEPHENPTQGKGFQP